MKNSRCTINILLVGISPRASIFMTAYYVSNSSMFGLGRDGDHSYLCYAPNTCDVTAVIGCKEGYGFCDFIRIARPPQRYGAQEAKFGCSLTLRRKASVSIGPGLTALTRILRSFRSTGTCERSY
jgi:hypothetical protein